MQDTLIKYDSQFEGPTVALGKTTDRKSQIPTYKVEDLLVYMEKSNLPVLDIDVSSFDAAHQRGDPNSPL